MKKWLGSIPALLLAGFCVAAQPVDINSASAEQLAEALTGVGKSKAELNQVKKDADAISAYVLAESLWFASRQLPENHAIMVGLGEGLMPKAGETPEMGSNPLLGFGRVYARPQVALFLDRRVHRLVNDPSYEWPEFWSELQTAGITVWGAAVDTLENTSRFAKGSPTGPMTVLHLFDQPRRPVVTDLEAALHTGDRGATGLGDDHYRLVVQRVTVLDLGRLV